MTKLEVLENIKKMIGAEFDKDEVICAFGGYEEHEENEVIVSKSDNNGYDYSAYINHPDSTQFCIVVNNNKIEDVWVY